MMTIYIISSDNSIHCIEAMQYFVNKYWIPNPPKVVVLSYNQPENFELSKNFEVVSMGVDEGTDTVTKKIEKYMSEIDEEHFIFTVDDFLPIKPVDVNLISYLENKIVNENISRINFENNFYNKKRKTLEEYNGHIISQLEYGVNSALISTIWSMWSKDFFLETIQETGNLWSWEKKANQYENQKHRVIGVENGGVLPTCHLFKLAKLKSDWYKIVGTDDDIDADDKVKIESFLDKWKKEFVIQLV